MDKVIKEGMLHLQTTESTCDVILSCKGHRLMAHKLILSIASPIFRDLLRDYTEAAVIILPDINATTMSSVLNYIYTGSTVVYSDTIQDFISLARFLRLQLDEKYLENAFPDKKTLYTEDIKNKPDVKLCKTPKKMPDLLPIRSLPKHGSGNRKPCNLVIPSPWCPRIDRSFMDDPRKVYLAFTETEINPQSGRKLEDSNNNFPPLQKHTHKKLDKVIRHLHFGVENVPENGTNTNPIAPSDLSKKYDDLANEVHVNSGEKNENVSDKIPDLSFSENNNSTSETTFKSGDVFSSSENSLDSSSNHAIERKPDKRKQFKCEDCGKTFSQLRNYKYHRSVHDGTKEFSAKCAECGKVFNDKGYLSSHMKIHRDKKEYACPHCPKRFNQRVAYNMHLRIHTGVKPHECPTCGKSFSRKMLLKQHQRVHTGERPYSCPECGKTFADRSNMSLHARLHTGIKPYACNLCPKSFTKKHHLKTHLNFHTGVKPYSCENCGLAFSQSSNMRTHYKKCILKAVVDGRTDSVSSIDNNSS